MIIIDNWHDALRVSVDIHDRPRLTALVTDLIARLDRARTDIAEREQHETRIIAGAEVAGIPCDHGDAAALSGAGDARHRRRVSGLALAALCEIGDTSWAESATDDEVCAAAATTLMAYRIGTGGGYQGPGDGTTRAVDQDILTSPTSEDSGWDVYLDALRVPRGGGFVRRYATGGDAWSAAALAAAVEVDGDTVTHWGYQLLAEIGDHPQAWRWQPALEPMRLAALADIAGREQG